MRDAAGELDDLDAARHLAGGVRQDLAVLVGDQPGQRARLAVEQFAEFEQDAGAGERRGRRPGGKRRGGSFDRPVDLGCGREGDPAASFAGRRVVDVAPAPARSLGALPVDIVVDIAHAGIRSLKCRRRTS